MNSFSKYETDTLMIIHSNLEKGVEGAIDTFLTNGPKAGYASTNYHVSLGLLAQVEDELWERGVDPHAKR